MTYPLALQLGYVNGIYVRLNGTEPPTFWNSENLKNESIRAVQLLDAESGKSA
jgi:hypothetical protein